MSRGLGLYYDCSFTIQVCILLRLKFNFVYNHPNLIPI
jgi:hypothetical protein